MKATMKTWGDVWPIETSDCPEVAIRECSFFQGCSSLHYHKSLINQILILEGCLDLEIHSNGVVEFVRLEGKNRDMILIDPEIEHRFIVVEPGRMLEFYWSPFGHTVSPEDDIYRIEPGSESASL